MIQMNTLQIANGEPVKASPDEQDCSWTFIGIELAAIYDRQQADTKGVIDRSNEYFDLVHPECKGWRDNKSLPDYCY